MPGSPSHRPARRRTSVILAAYLATLFLVQTACQPGHEQLTEPQTGSAVRQSPGVDDSAAPRRIVSLAPAITEVLYALELGDRVVGVTRYCTYPPEARHKPQVGGFLDLNLEAVVAARPDLVILTVASDHDTLARTLDDLGLRALQVEQRDLDSILGSIMVIAEACGAVEIGERLLAEAEARLDGVAALVRGRPRPRVLVVVGRQVGSGSIGSVWVAGQSSFYHQLIRLAGGINAVKSTAVTYPELSREALISLDPEVILDVVADLGQRELTAESALEDWSSLSQLQAVRSSRVRILTEGFTGIPGPRVAETAELLARAIHPEGPRRNNLTDLEPRCAADLARPIERDRRCSASYIEDLVIEEEPKMRHRWESRMEGSSCADPEVDRSPSAQ